MRTCYIIAFLPLAAWVVLGGLWLFRDDFRARLGGSRAEVSR